MLVLSPQDGQQNIIKAARDICHSVVQRNLNINEIDPAVVNKRLSGTCVDSYYSDSSVPLG